MSAYPRVRMHWPALLSGMISRLRFSGTLRARLTVALSVLILLAAALVTYALANHAAAVQIDAERRVAEGLLRVLAPALQMAPRQNYAALDGFLGRAAQDNGVAGVGIVAA